MKFRRLVFCFLFLLVCIFLFRCSAIIIQMTLACIRMVKMNGVFVLPYRNFPHLYCSTLGVVLEELKLIWFQILLMQELYLDIQFQVIRVGFSAILC